MAKVLRYAFLVLVILVLLLLLLPWLFKGEIFQKIKDEANANLKGELTIEDMSLSLFRDFPNLTVTLNNIVFTNEAPFNGHRLLDAETIRAELDIMSVFSGDQIQVNEIYLGNINAHVIILEDGVSNYLIMKESDEEGSSPETNVDEAPSGFNIALQDFRLEGLNLIYDDAESDINMVISDGSFQLAGNFNEVVTDVKTNTRLKELTVSYSGVDYLTKVLVDASMDAKYNQETSKLELSDNKVVLNQLVLNFNGWLQSFDDRITLDMAFSAPSTDFKEVLSLVPVVYMHDFQDVKASGLFALNGTVNGDYLYEGEDLPAFALNLNVDNASFSYPDLPESITQIEVDAKIDHPAGIADKTTVNISKADMILAGSPFHMQLYVARPVSDPLIDFDLQTSLDLEKLQKAVILEGYSLKGILAADVHIKGAMSDFENERYNAVEAAGYFQSGGLDIAAAEIKERILIDTLYTSITPSKFRLNPLQMQLGESDFTGSGQLDNMLAYALTDDTLSGSFNFTSDYINATQLMDMMATDETKSALNDSVETNNESEEAAFEVPANLDLRINAQSKKLRYTDFDLENVRATLLVKNSEVALRDVQSSMLGGTVGIAGTYKMLDGKPHIDADVNLKNLQAKPSFTTFNTVQSFAPVAESASGTYGGSLQLSSFLGSDYSPDLASLSASGSLLTKALILQPDLMKKIGELLGSTDFNKVLFEDANLSFGIEDGRVNVSPVKIMVGGYGASFSGSHGLDETMDYRLKTELPIEKINLPKELAALGIVKGTIPVEFKITGTLSVPKIKPVFGKAESVSELIDDVVDQVVDEVKDTVINTVNREAERVMAEAKVQADSIKAEAARQAAALKVEAKKQADALKAEARKQADKLLAEAKGDPLKEFAAKTAADAIIKEADKKIDELNAEANKQADDMLAKANAEADKIMKEAEERAKINK
jgi:hypothetical protein